MKMNKKKKWDERKGDWLFLLVLFLCSIAACVLGILCLGNVKNAFVRRYFLPLALFVAALFVSLCILAVWFTLSDRKRLVKGIFSLYLLLIFSLAVWLILQKTNFFAVVKNTESLQAYLESAGAWMPILYVALQFLQVVILPIPSVVSTLAGVALFGAFKAMLYSLIGILLGSFLAFFIGRKLGFKAVGWLVGEDTLKKWQRKLKGKDKLVLTLMFVLPVFPDDVLCLVAGLSSMSASYFTVVIFLSRVLGVAATCYSVNLIPFDTWWGITIWIAFAIIVVVVFLCAYKHISNKNRKNTKM